MQTAKEKYLTILRDKHADRSAFRAASQKITEILVFEAMQFLEWKRTEVETPLEKTAGIKLAQPIALIPILRSGLAMLPPFEKAFSEAKIGFLGLKRDETTYVPHLYYERMPELEKGTEILILDPMLATGGTAECALSKLIERGFEEEKILLVSIIAAPEGIALLERKFPKIKRIIAAIDRGLSQNKFILPGIGDFGDRYFGTD